MGYADPDWCSSPLVSDSHCAFYRINIITFMDQTSNIYCRKEEGFHRKCFVKLVDSLNRLPTDGV